METIFSKIINGEIPADIVYEDDLVLAFLDIKPANHGHTLVIPKKSFMNIFDGDSDTLAHMMKIGHHIGVALKKADLATGVNLVMNNGESAGQVVWHAHLHVIPRFNNDGIHFHPKSIESTREEFLTIKEKLVKALK